MIELVLVVFLLAMAVMATVAVKVGMKAVDFIDATYLHYRTLEEGQKEVIRLLTVVAREEGGSAR
jgi:hypothetical protein